MTMWGDPDWDTKTEHTFYALKSFRFWGNKVGFISGDMKEKWGEPRWSANITGVDNLYKIFNVGYYYYRWSPEQSPKYFILNTLNNWSMFFFRVWPVWILTLWYQTFFYNVAYWIPMIRHHKKAYSIYCEADWKELLWFAGRYAHRMGEKYEGLTFPKNRKDITGENDE